ncbi:MAG: MBL fold metallo-hydrolase, partial [Segetibacter sp.]
MKLYSINAGFFKLDGGAMFGVVPKSIWNKLNAADENNMCSWALRCLLIDTGERRILIDTGMGNKQDPKFFRHYYLHGNDTLESSLANKGFTKDDITDVFHTHLHFDHCGGTIAREGEKLVPAFKNATLWSNEQHWEWATLPNEREKASFLKENILPMQESGRMRFAEVKEGVSLFDEDITLKFAYGHTDAMMLPTIRYKGKTIVYMADLLPSIAHLPLPYVMSYDMFPLKT